MPKAKLSLARRKKISRNIERVIVERYGTLYEFEKDHPELAGRVATWIRPRTKEAQKRFVWDNIKAPDLAGLFEFVEAVSTPDNPLSLAWLLEGDGDAFPLEVALAREVLARVNQAAPSPWHIVDGAALLERLTAKGIEEAHALAKWRKATNLWVALHQARDYATRQPTPGSFGDQALREGAVTAALEDGAPTAPETMVLYSASGADASPAKRPRKR